MRQVRTITLSGRLQARHDLNRLCAEAINRQIESGQAEPTHLRNRRRHLARQILKRIPHVSRLSAKRLMHAAAMVLAMWGFSGMTMPRQAGAAPVFQHTSLAGFDVGRNAKPTFVDIDNDGDLDAFAGERNGTVKFYRNTGTAAAPNFVAANGTTIINPLAAVAVGYNAAPTFADIDNDGDLDAFIGELYGTVKFYRNDDVSGNGTAPVFVAVTGAGNPLAGFDVGSYVTPTFADIDNDGDLDAFIGESTGTVKFYRNTGTNAAPVFAADAAGNPLAGFDVGLYAAPTFADIDNDGDLDAFVGEGFGTVKFYRNTGAAAAPVFAAANGTTIINPLAAVDVVGDKDNFKGNGATPTFADIDNDGDLDAFVGEYSSTAKFYRNTGTAAAPVFAANPLAGFDVGFYATPAFADIDNDGDLDAFAGESTGTVKFYRNTGTSAAPVFAAANGTTIINPLAGFYSGGRTAPAFADIDNDGDLDAFLGGFYGTVKFFRNDDASGNGTAPVFVAVTGAGNPLNGVAVGLKATPTFADIDNDGDLDAFVGESTGTVKFYRNTGTAAAPNFAADAAANPLAGFGVGGSIRAAPAFADIDNDGDLDAFVGEPYGTVKFYRNTGTAAAPNFAADAAANPLAGFNVGGIGSAPAFADIDNDGDLDAFVGEGFGTVQFFENFDPSPVTMADALTVTAGLAATTADVTANDSFKPEGPAASFTIAAFTQGAHGAVADNGGNTFTYTPTAGFTGVDSFTYTLSDGAGNTAVGTVNVTVSANSAPAPTAPAINTNEDISASSQISPNDPDVGDTQAYAVTTAATNGSASVDASGLASYAPNANFNGADSFVVTVTDAAGATGTVTINATVNAVNDPPVITLTGTTPLNSEAGQAYADAGATATDIEDGNLTGSIVTLNPVNTGVLGQYIVTYNVTDSGSLAATQVTRTVNVVDTIAPVITLSGASPVNINAGTPYVDAGATANDSFEGNLTAGIVTVNPVNTNVPGVYIVTYNVSDSSTNPAPQVTRTVNVNAVTVVPPTPLPGGGTVGLAAPPGASLFNASAGPVPPGAPPGVVFPLGTISYSVLTPAVGASVTVTLTFSAPLPANLVLYKIDSAGVFTLIPAGPPPAGKWVQTGPNTVDLTLIDGGPFDQDGVANGIIVDPLVPGAAAPAPPAPPPPPAPAAVGVNGLFFTTGGSLSLTGAVTPGSRTGTVVDAYITITLPTRQTFYLQPDGSWSLTIAPVVASWPLAPVSGTILDYVFQGTEPPGVYFAKIFFTLPATMTPVGREARRFFIFTP